MIKKISILILLTFLISCSSDSDEQNQQFQSKNRIRKVIDKIGNYDYILNFIYNGDVNECYSIQNESGDYYINYFYQDNLLVTSYQNNREYHYTYENGTISEVTVTIFDNVNEKFKYFYNSENQIIKCETYELQNGVLEYFQYTNYLYDSTGNNYRTEYYTPDSNLIVYEINTYDNKNNIFKNFEPKITIMQFNPIGNNLLTRTQYSTDPTIAPAVTTYEYEYNANGYPIKSTINYPNNSNVSHKEYIYD